MLNQRQIGILLILYENFGSTLTTEQIARKLKASLRTIQADMQIIRAELEQIGFAKLQSRRAKGTGLLIEDHTKFSDWINNLYMQHTVGEISYPLERITRIIYILLERFRDMPMHELEDMLYVSHSTLQSDLKNVQASLQPFRLNLSRDWNRLFITGAEIDKRICLAENELYLTHLQGFDNDGKSHINMQRISFLKDVLIDCFMESRYYISDMDFNNAVLTLNIAIHRMQKSFFIKEGELTVTGNIDKELSISRKIFERISARFFCEIPESEIEFFAVYLRGKEIFKNHDIISAEMDEFINDAFSKIRLIYGVDFTNNISLHISIALHCIPLIVRIKHNMQIRSKSLANVKRTFPLGYEIAQVFTFLLKEKYVGDKKISEDEIALIAAHFYGSLLELHQKKKRTRVLVLSEMKVSMTILLRSIMMKWFIGEISVLDFLNSNKMNESLLDNYDIFLTTEKNKFYDNGLAMYIAPFPTENDRRNIKLLLDGFDDLEDILYVFHRDLFFVRDTGEKSEILRLLASHAEKKFSLVGLHAGMLQREKIGSTFFSKGIAIPHPLHSISSDIFVAVYISKNPIVWDEEGNAVQVVTMLHIGKNNPRSFQLWDYFARILEDKDFVDKIVAEPTFEFFTQKIRLLMTDGNKKQ